MPCIYRLINTENLLGYKPNIVPVQKNWNKLLEQVSQIHNLRPFKMIFQLILSLSEHYI